MEHSSLQAALEKLKSDSNVTTVQGLEDLREWLHDTTNVQRAEKDPEVFPTIVRVVINLIRRQVVALSKPGNKKQAFKVDGGSCLVVVLRAACRGGGRGVCWPPRLAKAQRKIWEHFDEILHSETVSSRAPGLLPYYCRAILELGENRSLGYLSDLRGDLLHRLLRQLLQIRGADAQNAAVDAAALLVRGVDADVSSDFEWLCDRAVALLSSGSSGSAAANCLAAICLRCPLAFRDWLFLTGRADMLADAMLRISWSPKSCDGLGITLRLALGFRAPVQQKHALGLLHSVADALESLARSESSGITGDVRVARLAEVMAVVLLHAEPTSAAALQRLSSMLEQRVLPWSLCVIRLFEGHAAVILGERHCGVCDNEEMIVTLFDLLLQQLVSKGPRLVAQEVTALHYALVGILSARAWARIWPEGVWMHGLPVPLGALCGEATSAFSLAAPGLIAALPYAVVETAACWLPRMQDVMQYTLAACAPGLLPSRSLHHLLAVFFITAPRAAVEGAASQFLAQQSGLQGALGASQGPPRAAEQASILAALRWHQADPDIQRALYRRLSTCPATIRSTLLQLCSKDTRWITTPVTSPLQANLAEESCDDDIDCAHAPLEQDDFERAASNPDALGALASADGAQRVSFAQRWYQFQYCRLLQRVEATAASTAMDASSATSSTGGGGIAWMHATLDDIRVHHATEAAAFRVWPATWRLGATDLVAQLIQPLCFVAGGADEQSSPAHGAAMEDLTTKARKFLASTEAAVTAPAAAENADVAASTDYRARLQLAVALLPTLGVAQGAMGGLAPAEMSACLRRLLEFACDIARSGAGPAEAGTFYEGLADFLSEHDAAAEKDAGFLADAEVSSRCSSLAQLLWESTSATTRASTVAAPGVTAGGSDLFEGRSTGANAGAQRQDQMARAPALRLLTALGLCSRGADSASGGPGGAMTPADCLKQTLLGLWRTEPAMVVPALRLVTLEIAQRRGAPPPPALLTALAEAWAEAPEPPSLREAEDLLLCALRLTMCASSWEDRTRLLLKRLWDGDGLLAAILSKWRRDLHSVSPRGKLICAVVCTQTFRLLYRKRERDAVTDLFAECTMGIVPDLILKDSSSEVRITVAAECTKALFEFFDPKHVYPELEASWEPLVDGAAGQPDAHATSLELATVQVMLSIGSMDRYTYRVLPVMCAVRPGLRSVIRLALAALDERLVGSRGREGTSRIALLLRARIFEVHLRAGRRLAELPLADLSLQLPPRFSRSGLGRHVAASVAAMVVTEELGQLSDLAVASGYATAGEAGFESLIFIPLAATLIVMCRSLEPLRTKYGPGKAIGQCKACAHHILAFSLQMPFLTAGTGHVVDAQRIRTTFGELDKQLPWSDFPAFVNKHFHFLLNKLDQIIHVWALWVPAVAADLLREFASWFENLGGARLRLLVPMLHRHANVLPQIQRKEVSTVIGVIIGKNQPALVRIILHRDESIRELLLAAERAWMLTGKESQAPGYDDARVSACPSLGALVVILQVLRRACRESAAAACGDATDWLRLQVEAMLPRLKLSARKLLSQEVDATSDLVEGVPAAKKQRGMCTQDTSRALRPLEPPKPQLMWGPPPAPDLGALVRCLDMSGECGLGSDSCSLARLLWLLAQPSIVAQMRRDAALACKVALGLSQLSPAAIAQIGEEMEDDLIEIALPKLCTQESPQTSQASSQARQTQGPGVDKSVNELLCSGALLGASALQVHVSISVRRHAFVALGQLLANQQISAGARGLLARIVDPQHLCLEDLKDFMPADSMPHLQKTAIGDNATISDVWSCVGKACAGQSYSVWVRALCSKLLALGRHAWDEPAASIMLACAPLAQRVEWFAERMFVLAILKAANHKSSGRQLATAVSNFLQQDFVETAQAQCIIRGLHYVRLYQTAQLRRAVPHFPADKTDPFWGSLDLFAVAKSASLVGCAQEGLLYLECYLSRQHPDIPIEQTILKPRDASVSVDELFTKPSQEAGLLHGLAKQLPDDDLLYGVSEWCHASSRLVRAELGHDHLLQLRLRSDLREAELRSGGGARSPTNAQAGLEKALARLGLYTVFAGFGDGIHTSSVDKPSRAASAASADFASTWERRMEGLWRLRQWGDGASRPWSHATTPTGFHAELHGSLTGLAAATVEAPVRRLACSGIASFEASAAPLARLVADVASGLHTRSLEQRRAGVVRLQMLGSVFAVIDAAKQDEASGASTSASGRNVNALAARWSTAASTPLSSPHFMIAEPLAALRATLLSLAASRSVELRFLTTLAAQMREAAQVHRALGLLEQAQCVSQEAPRPDLLRLHWEQARCFWELRQQQECLSIARAIASECQMSPSQTRVASADKDWAGRALSQTGIWLALSRMENPQIIQDRFLEPAVSMAPADPMPRRRLAEFLDARLGEEIARQCSMDQGVQREFRSQTKKDYDLRSAELQSLLRKPVRDETYLKQLQEHVKSREKQLENDKAQEAEEKERQKTLAMAAVSELGRCLVESKPGETTSSEGQSLTRFACRFLSLWFDYSQEYPDITGVVRKAIPSLALGALSPFLYQLASRLDTQETEFQKALEEILLRIAGHGAHNIWPLLLLKNGDQVPKGMRGADKFKADLSKIEASKRVLERLRRESSDPRVLEATELLGKFYMNIAFFEVDKKNRNVRIKISAIQGYKEVRKVLQNVPVPTATPPGEGAPPAPGILKFSDSFGVAQQGLSAPKMLSVTDGAGREHAQIVKGMDDLRQDAVHQQLFRLLNDVLGENARSRQAELQMRTFQVVPLSPCSGIMERVSAVTLGDLLTGNTFPHEGAHHRYRPQDWSYQKCRDHLQDARKAYDNSADTRHLDKAYQDAIAHFKPVMHLTLMECFPAPAAWHRARNRYARSVAVSSMVGYIVGLGDRHPNNMLFDKSTGELVHIDFGITFEAGKNLRVPELVPCRLTRDIVDGLGCLGTCGPFRRDSETALGVLREAASLVNAVVEVFVHDPVYNWSLSHWKAQRAENSAQDAGGPRGGAFDFAVPAGAVAAADGNEMAKRALLTVKGKLHGEHAGAAAALGVPAHVAWIIREAMDPNNLGRMWFGWSQWL